MKIINISLDKLDAAPYQASSRTHSRALKKLAACIKEHGLQTPINVVAKSNGRWQIANGHQRVEAHKILGLPTIDAVESSTSSPVSYAIGNTSKAMTGYEWMHAKLQNSRVKIPWAQERDLKRCMEIFGGPSGVQQYMDNGTDKVAPHIAYYIDMVNRQFVTNPPPGEPPPSLRDIGIWMIKFGSGPVKQLLSRYSGVSDRRASTLLAAAIRKGKSL